MERQQYDEARKSLNRALRLAEKEDRKNHAANANNGSINHHSNNKNKVNTTPPDFDFERHNHSPMELCRVVSTETSLNTTATTTTTRVGKENNTTTGDIDIDTNAIEIETEMEIETSKNVTTTPIVRSPFELFANNDNSNDDDEILTDNSDSTTKSTSSSSKHRSEYDEGMDYFKSPFRLVNNSSRSLNGTVLFNLGRISHNQGNLDEALRLYKKSLSAIGRLSSSSSSSSRVDEDALTLAVLFGIGKIQYVQGDHVGSLNTYMTALTSAQSHFGEHSIEVAACLNCIGVLHYMMPIGDDTIAMDALQTSLQQRLKLLGENHIDVGTTWNNVGRMYFQLGKYDLAMEAYCEALRIRRKCQGESVDVAATLFNCGQVYHNLE